MAAIHGNYQGYAGSHRPLGIMPSSHILDTRLQLLTSFSADLFADKRILDIGSNQGNIPVDIALHFSPRSVTGIEADPGLVNKSKSHLSFRWSRLGPEGEVDWFPASSVLSHGHVPYPPHPPASDSSSGSEGGEGKGKGKGKQREEEAPRRRFPHNVTFECRDFVADVLASREKGYGTEKEFDVVLMLSVVKWLHLEGGDDGLAKCFMRIHNLLTTGGHFVLEPQGSDSYERAVKKNPELKAKREALKIKPEEFVSLLEREYGFELAKSLGEGERKRMVYVFKKL